MARTNPITGNRNWGQTVLLTAAGGLLCWFAAPRLAAEYQAWTAVPVEDARRGGGEVSTEDLGRAAAALESAAQLSGSADQMERAAALRLAMARDFGLQSAWGREAADHGLALARQGLTAAPGEPFAWFWLAQAETLVHGPSPLVVDAWRMSVETGPYAPEFSAARLGFGFRQYAHFDDAGHAAMDRAIKAHAAWLMWTLVDAAVENNGIAITRAALADNPSKRAEFEYQLGKKAAKP